MDETGVDSTEIDLTDETGTEIDLRDRLRFAAGALAADFGDRLPAELAESLVFSSAQGLLVSASVTEFVPIFAERRARQAIRLSAPVPAIEVETGDPEPEPDLAPSPADNGAAPKANGTAPAAGGVAPIVAVPGETFARLRGEVEQLRQRVMEWRAEQDRRDVSPA